MLPKIYLIFSLVTFSSRKFFSNPSCADSWSLINDKNLIPRGVFGNNAEEDQVFD